MEKMQEGPEKAQENEALREFNNRAWPHELEGGPGDMNTIGGRDFVHFGLSIRRIEEAFRDGFRAAMALVEKRAEPARQPTGTAYHIEAADSLGVNWTLPIARVRTSTDAHGILHVRLDTHIPFASRKSPEPAPVINEPVQNLEHAGTRIDALFGINEEVQSGLRAHARSIEDMVLRIEKLEQHPERLGSSEKHADRRLESLEMFQGSARNEIGGIWRCLRGEQDSELSERLVKLEKWRGAMCTVFLDAKVRTEG